MTNQLDDVLVAQARVDTPLGAMTAAATTRGLAGLWFDGQAHHPGPLAAPDNPQHPHIAQALRELQSRGELGGRTLSQAHRGIQSSEGLSLREQGAASAERKARLQVGARAGRCCHRR